MNLSARRSKLKHEKYNLFNSQEKEFMFESALSPHMSAWKRLSPHKWSDKTSFSVTRTRLHPKPSEKGVESFASENNKHESNNKLESNNKHATHASYLRFIHLHCRHAPLAFAETEEKLW